VAIAKAKFSKSFPQSVHYKLVIMLESSTYGKKLEFKNYFFVSGYLMRKQSKHFLCDSLLLLLPEIKLRRRLVAMLAFVPAG
jgi:hypothetical protein